MQSQGGGVPESRYTMSYSHASLAADGVDLYGHAGDPYVLQHQHHMHASEHLGLGSPGQHHGHSGKRSADVAGLNLKQDPMVGDVSMSSIGMGHSTMDDGGSGQQSGNPNNGQPKKTPPPNGKKTKGRVKIKMEFIDNKLRRYTTFSKRKTGIMKKAYELSTLTGTQVMLLVASETGHVYTFATRKLQPMITSEAGKALIQTCLNSPDPPSSSADQRMSATGFEETELTYTLHDEDQKEGDSEEDENEAPSSDGNSRSPSPAPSPPETNRASGSGPNAPAVDASSAPSAAHQAAKTSGAVNLTASQLANLAASLPSLPGLPSGANLASLLASVSASMAGGAGSAEAARSNCKNLPQLISLAHVGVALAASAKDASSSAKSVVDQSDGAALDLHSSEKKGAANVKKRSRKSKK